VQQKYDGTHVILPATVHLRMAADTPDCLRCGSVTDGKMRRDSVRAALLQRHCAVAERGRLHGASGLAGLAADRIMAWIKEACRKRERKREWLRSARQDAQLRQQQDKAKELG
jgi:hypothetical protein